MRVVTLNDSPLLPVEGAAEQTAGWTGPVSRSRQSVIKRSWSHAVSKTRSPARTGDECPAGTDVFQSKFLAGPNSTGRPVASDTPEPFGPRKRGQSSAPAARQPSAISSKTEGRRMGSLRTNRECTTQRGAVWNVVSTP